MKIAVFAYNFPHKKTQDFLFNMFIAGIKVNCVIACDSVNLNLPSSCVRIKPKHIDLIHPKEICERFNYPYFNLAHNSTEAENILLENDIDIGIIAGARLLKNNIIGSCKTGIVNFHPGILPYARGLDSIKWSIYYDLPLGVSAHFIDSKIDAGRLITTREIDIYPDDSLIDISLRIEQTQNIMLIDCITKAGQIADIADLPLVDTSYNYFRSMPNEIERLLDKKLAERLKNLPACK